MRFQKGNKYGKGRPKKPEIDELRKALLVAKEKHNLSLLEHFVERAYLDDSVLIAVMKKMLPDLKASDTNLNMGDTLQDFLKWLKEREKK